MDRSDWADEAFGAMASLVPFAGPFLEEPAKKAFRAVRDEQARARSVALKTASFMSGLSREDLAEAIAADPRLIPLATRVLFAAGMTGQDDMLNALGAALGSAVRSPDEADDVELILIGLQDLRCHHLEVLRLLAQPARWFDSSSAPPRWAESQIQAETAGWNVEAVAEVLAVTVDAAYLRCVALSRAGFTRARSGLGGDGYRATTMGLTLIEVLESYEATR